MKKMIAALFTAVLMNSAIASDKNLQDKEAQVKKAATYQINQNNLQSTIHFDGENTVKYGIFTSDQLPVKVQLMWDNVSMMNIRYREQSISDGMNLKELPAGVYTFRITHGSEVIEKRIIKTNTSNSIFE